MYLVFLFQDDVIEQYFDTYEEAELFCERHGINKDVIRFICSNCGYEYCECTDRYQEVY